MVLFTSQLQTNKNIKMKTKLLLLLLTISSVTMYAQTNPDIEGDLMLCPWTDGTAYVTNPTFDTYQWYYKYWFVSNEFVAIEGATEATFTYDWFTYDQALLKVVATVGGQSYESDTIQIDSWAWAAFYFIWELTPGVTFDWETETFFLEQGAVFSPAIDNPPYDTLIQWYRNDQPIEGANGTVYDITKAGVYTCSAAPSFCPGSITYSIPLTVEMLVDVPVIDPERANIYPNPANSVLNIDLKANTTFNKYSILDLSGRVLLHDAITPGVTPVSTDNLAKGFYILKLQSVDSELTRQFIKQ
jgi:hypothetical protein